MERRALFLTLALALPLALYGVPYAYASISSSDYAVTGTVTVGFGTYNNLLLHCNSGDYAVSGGYKPQFLSGGDGYPKVIQSQPTFNGADPTTGQTPNGWFFEESLFLTGTASAT